MVVGTGVCCIALLPAVMATLAIGSSILSTVWCEAIKFTPDLSNTPEFINLSEAVRDVLSNEKGFANLKFGLYYYGQVQDVTVESAGDTFVRVTDSCAYYENVDFDAAWHTARAFALIAPITAGLFAIGLYMAPCCIFYNRATWNSMACFFLFVIPIFQSFTLLFLTSDACKDNPVVQQRMEAAIQLLSGLEDTTTSSSSTTTEAPMTTTSGNTTDANATAVETTTTDAPVVTSGIGSDAEEALRSIYASDCEWDWGMYANLLSMILFFVTGVIMLLMGAPKRPEPKEPEIQEVTYEKKIDDAGEEVVEEVNVETDTFNGGAPAWASTAPKPVPY